MTRDAGLKASASIRPATVAAAAEVDRVDLAEVAAAVADCRAYALWEHATQTVFGRGPVLARVMLVGEHPGDREDTLGKPFVGPAGRLLA